MWAAANIFSALKYVVLDLISESEVYIRDVFKKHVEFMAFANLLTQ